MITPSVTVTTSWDDGHRLDSRLADTLMKYQMPGTFYISPRSTEMARADRLTPPEIVRLSECFEIGAHTMTHPRLTRVGLSRARSEILDSKNYLEDLVGRPVTSFCYPYGDFSMENVRLVGEAGFTYARTTSRFSYTRAVDPLRSPTTVHAYSHWSDVASVAKQSPFSPVRAWEMYRSWDCLAMHLFDRALETGGVFHLWGHSWEVDDRDEWQALERVLKHISGRREVNYLVNRDVAALRGAGL